MSAIDPSLGLQRTRLDHFQTPQQVSTARRGEREALRKIGEAEGTRQRCDTSVELRELKRFARVLWLSRTPSTVQIWLGLTEIVSKTTHKYWTLGAGKCAQLAGTRFPGLSRF